MRFLRVPRLKSVKALINLDQVQHCEERQSKNGVKYTTIYFVGDKVGISIEMSIDEVSEELTKG